MPETKKLSLEPYKGTRDFYPEDQFVQEYIFRVWRRVVESYGYLEYAASLLEETELYKAKSGEEIINEQTYSFTDRGGREVTIRPEMTPTVARMVAQKRKELSFPLRWYSIPNLFRYERPQRGRLREHWQLNVDMFGVESVEADLELISIAYDIMKAFGAKDGQFEIRLNSRKLLNATARIHNLSSEQEYRLTKLLDKAEKITPAAFAEKLVEICGSPDKARLVDRLIKTTTLAELDEEFKKDDGVRQLTQVYQRLLDKGISNVKFKYTLARGLDYYTGVVFEMYDTNPKNPRALFGGGRYDDLVGIFGVDKVPGVGFGWGDVTTRDFLETYNLLPAYRPTTDLYICHLEGCLPAAGELATKLRREGLRVGVDLTDRKVSAQVKSADRQKIPYVLVVGEEEVRSGKYKLKELASGNEQEAAAEQLAGIILKQ
ncbi:MAG TPA: histidine--tRNA ligase [Patescibacteria group bacterium]|nr:histidine--tRNA ligase [Patescibacteria group bacterium]